MALSLEYPEGLIESISLSPEHAGRYSDLTEVFKAIDSVSANDVNAVRIQRKAVTFNLFKSN